MAAAEPQWQAVIGTISATVIQSSPSMKLTRFTNQRPATKISNRSTQSGRDTGCDAQAGRNREQDQSDRGALEHKAHRSR